VAIAVCVLVAAALAAFVVVRMQGRGPQDAEQAATTEEPAPSEVVPVETAADSSATAEPAAATAAKSLPRLIDLGSTTCVPCKMMAPILDEMKKTFAGQLEVQFVDVRKDAAAAKQYGIQVIPTQIFFDASGKELFRHQGFFSREDILAKWTELGVKLDG
jgi:thioredoxin 1